MKIKICGLFRDEDIDFANEARPDYIGFVFAKSTRQISSVFAQYLRFRLANEIIPVGVFVNSPAAEIADLHRNGVISIAQLHGDEDESFIIKLKKETGSKPIPVIKTISGKLLEINYKNAAVSNRRQQKDPVVFNYQTNADYLLIDSGAGSGKTFDWELLKYYKFSKPWFLAGGINIKNIKDVMPLNPFAVDVSSGAETDSIKDREKILKLTASIRCYNENSQHV